MITLLGKEITKEHKGLYIIIRDYRCSYLVKIKKGFKGSNSYFVSGKIIKENVPNEYKGNKTVGCRLGNKFWIHGEHLYNLYDQSEFAIAVAML